MTRRDLLRNLVTSVAAAPILMAAGEAPPVPERAKSFNASGGYITTSGTFIINHNPDFLTQSG